MVVLFLDVRITPLQVILPRDRAVDVWAIGYGTFVKSFSKGDIYAWGLNNYSQLGIECVQYTNYSHTQRHLEKTEKTDTYW